MDLQERVLGFGMLHSDSHAAVSYARDGEVKVHSKKITDSEFAQLSRRFRLNPEKYIRNGIDCLDAIKTDNGSSHSRLERYFGAYQSLLLELDAKSFDRSDTRVFSGVPEYLADGLSDMGSDSALDERFRDREKQYVDKKSLFRKSQELFRDVLISPNSIHSGETVHKVASHVYANMPYTKQQRLDPRPIGFRHGGSIPTHAFMGPQDNGAVCRHQGLYTAVLLQSLGIKGRILKCDVDFGNGRRSAHVANLIEGKTDWYLLDVTNPVTKDGKRHLALQKLDEPNIDVNKNVYEWNMETDGGTRTYTSRSNMFYRLKEV